MKEEQENQQTNEETEIKPSAKEDVDNAMAKIETLSAFDKAVYKEDQDGYIHVTLPRDGGEIILGPPKLKHRKMLLGILKALDVGDEAKEVIAKFAKNRGISVKEMAKLEEKDMTDEEKVFFETDENLEDLSDMAAEIIFVTVRKSPWGKDGRPVTLDVLEEELEYSDALLLIGPAMRLISNSLISDEEQKK